MAKDDQAAFERFSADMGQTYAQNRQDIWALWECGTKPATFVEIGAGDGIHHSNTYLLESRFGWTGAVAEPQPRYAEALARNRTCSVFNSAVFMQDGDTVDFIASDVPQLSRIASVNPGDKRETQRMSAFRRISVSTITADTLLSAASPSGSIAFLSIDTEGSELDILKTIDFNRWQIKAIAVEHNYTALREQIFELLSRFGFVRKWPELSRYDDWYVRACRTG